MDHITNRALGFPEDPLSGRGFGGDIEKNTITAREGRSPTPSAKNHV